MPYPAEGLYSLSHVNYTPHESWTDESGLGILYSHFSSLNPDSKAGFMVRSAQRLPTLSEARYEKSLEVKTVPVKNEADDGRPILYQQKPDSIAGF